MPSCLIKNKFVKFILRDNCDCAENVFCKYCCVITQLIILAICYWQSFGIAVLYIMYVLPKKYVCCNVCCRPKTVLV